MEKKDYSKSYSEPDFWEKVGKYAKKAGREIVVNALKLYYAMALGKATKQQIAAIIAALGYFISPIDAIPDLLPGGLVDDGGILAIAVTTLACCSDPEVVAAANKKADEWFG